MLWNIFKRRRNGLFFIISAPSGGGKSTIIEKVMHDLPFLQKTISYTTREPRTGEEDGRDYYFVSRRVFSEMREKGKFIEWAEVHGNFYATSFEKVETALRENKYLIKDIDTQGALNLKKRLGGKAILIFIKPPSFEELRKRLMDRHTDPVHTIELRLKNAESEMRQSVHYKHVLVNDVLQRTVDELKGIINGYVKNG